MYIRIPVFAALMVVSSNLFAQSPFGELRNIASQLESAIRSQSEASNRPSMAMIDRETARSMNYDNRLKHVQTYYEKRKLRREYRQAERLPRRSAAEISASASRSAPKRLTIQQYDPYEGRISWPVVFQETNYDRGRQYIDRLFAAHAQAGGGINTKYYAAIQSSLKGMNRLLYDNFENTNPEQFTYAQKFLKSLQYEARFPVGS